MLRIWIWSFLDWFYCLNESDDRFILNLISKSIFQIQLRKKIWIEVYKWSYIKLEYHQYKWQEIR